MIKKVENINIKIIIHTFWKFFKEFGSFKKSWKEKFESIQKVDLENLFSNQKYSENCLNYSYQILNAENTPV